MRSNSGVPASMPGAYLPDSRNHRFLSSETHERPSANGVRLPTNHCPYAGAPGGLGSFGALLGEVMWNVVVNRTSLVDTEEMHPPAIHVERIRQENPWT